MNSNGVGKAWIQFLNQHPNYEHSAGMAYFLTEFIYLFAKYFCDLKVNGVENIPYGNRFAWTHNHSGWMAVDAPLIGHLLGGHKKVEKIRWSGDRMGFMAHFKKILGCEPGDWGVSFWHDVGIQLPFIGWAMRVFHGLPVSHLKDPKKLNGYRIYATPAEGEEGSFKSSIFELYHLKRFRTGVARLALENNLDYLLPVSIVGPEETFPNLGNISFFKKILGFDIPLPLPVLPIPVNWVVSFLRPVPLREYRRQFKKSRSLDGKKAICQEIMDRVRADIAAEIKKSRNGRRPFSIHFQSWPWSHRSDPVLEERHFTEFKPLGRPSRRAAEA